MVRVRNVPLLVEDWKRIIRLLKQPEWLSLPQLVWNQKMRKGDICMTTDASKTGFGAVIPPFWCFEQWPSHMRS